MSFLPAREFQRWRHGASPTEASLNELAPSVTRARLRHTAYGTYLSEILASRDSSLSRWPTADRAPLLVWIRPSPPPADLARWTRGGTIWSVTLPQAAHDAVEAWNQVGLPRRLRFTRDSADADITVSWIPRFREPISGRTRWERTDDWWITGAHVTLALEHSTGQPLGEAAMYAISLHELGHALGLDHTSDPMSVMTPVVRVRELSPTDIATARLLYELPAGRIAVGGPVPPTSTP